LIIIFLSTLGVSNCFAKGPYKLLHNSTRVGHLMQCGPDILRNFRIYILLQNKKNYINIIVSLLTNLFVICGWMKWLRGPDLAHGL